ncbi:GNAT family N-acetyltransferase [Alkalicoccobacillus porphyridii]|uniref:GNAT family N-acetyltransferase n=1 Tax=Alkalicoccobacillus porphyridii TaxID=2597270 RepID=A0A553ZWU1_9BACI|nr:GNAT family N-acetyltransferase [Alkalicoccobacillus porphyridii]TSB45902.1 GNAT family N-acetyltransferase [Alkalicoccobacillus porphyridii]
MNIELVTEETRDCLKLPNEKFQIFGELVVTKANEKWEYTERYFEKSKEKIFPEENYIFETMNENGFAVATFDQDQCVGLAVFETGWNKYCYLSDLKVKANYRRTGISRSMLDLAITIAKKKNCKGFSTIAQAYNLAANKFYLKYGFEIGGLNTRNYEFTSEKGNSDIYYYLNF